MFLYALIAIGLYVYANWKWIWKHTFRILHKVYFTYKRWTLDANLYKVRPDIRIPNSVLSLTSSPSRLASSLPKVLRAFAGQVDSIELNLPMLYRNTQAYAKQDIQSLQSEFSNLKVYRQDKDLGPVLKLLPTAERHMGSNVVVFTLDDDAIPPTDMLRNLESKVRATHSVATCNPRSVQVHGKSYSLVFGNMSTAYPAWRITQEVITTLRQYASLCRTHDDLAIGAALDTHGVLIAKLDGYEAMPYSFDEGADENALWAMDLFKDKDVECATAIYKFNITAN